MTGQSPKPSYRVPFSIKALKRNARKNLKEHYLLFVVVCLIAVLISAEFVTTDNVIGISTGSLRSNYSDVDILAESTSKSFIGTVYSWFDRTTQANDSDSAVFGRTKGTLNAIFDYVGNNSFLTHTYNTFNLIFGSDHVTEIVMSILGALVAVVFWFLIQNTYIVISRRIFLEGRIYKKVPFSRYLYLLRVKRLLSTAVTLAIWTASIVLSSVTIVLGPVVFYGFFLVPYIVAENPDIGTFEALRLSWRLMRGNKMRAFLLDLSLVGWYILGVLTLGMTNIFYANPYRVAIYSELYATIRNNAVEKKIPGYGFLSDAFLFARCSPNKLLDTYSDVYSELSKPEYKLEGLSGRNRFMADHFGVVLWNTKDEMEYEEHEGKRVRLLAYKDEAEGRAYPSRLFAIPDKRKRRSLEYVHYMRHYSLLSLVVMFFTFSGFGWVWELIYYYIQQGRVINRGVLHGPWLPIYGAGGLAVLIFLHPVRKKPLIHFWATVILCGTVEYFTGWFLEAIYGQKWWDYSGYFFNIHGRVCAEGLFVFGMAGMAFIYVLAPLLDDRVRKWNKAVLTPIAVVLVAVFVLDMVCSRFIPNTGSGITGDFDNAVPRVTEEPVDPETAP